MGKSVGNGLEDDDAAEPAVHQVVRVKRNSQEWDERVISASQEKERDLLEALDKISKKTSTGRKKTSTAE